MYKFKLDPKCDITEESKRMEQAQLKFKTKYGQLFSNEGMKFFFLNMKFDIIPLMNKENLTHALKLKITKNINQQFEIRILHIKS